MQIDSALGGAALYVFAAIFMMVCIHIAVKAQMRNDRRFLEEILTKAKKYGIAPTTNSSEGD